MSGLEALVSTSTLSWMPLLSGDDEWLELEEGDASGSSLGEEFGLWETPRPQLLHLEGL